MLGRWGTLWANIIGWVVGTAIAIAVIAFDLPVVTTATGRRVVPGMYFLAVVVIAIVGVGCLVRAVRDSRAHRESGPGVDDL